MHVEEKNHPGKGSAGNGRPEEVELSWVLEEAGG
jgi:hypothetical protein